MENKISQHLKDEIYSNMTQTKISPIQNNILDNDNMDGITRTPGRDVLRRRVLTRNAPYQPFQPTQPTQTVMPRAEPSYVPFGEPTQPTQPTPTNVRPASIAEALPRPRRGPQRLQRPRRGRGRPRAPPATVGQRLNNNQLLQFYQIPMDRRGITRLSQGVEIDGRVYRTRNAIINQLRRFGRQGFATPEQVAATNIQRVARGRAARRDPTTVAYPALQWESRIQQLIRQQNLQYPLTLVLTSGIVAGVRRVFTFNSPEDLQRFISATIEEDYTNESNKQLRQYGRDIFRDGALITIGKLAGGVSDVKERTVEYKNGKWKFTLFSPRSNRNNCGIRCLEKAFKEYQLMPEDAKFPTDHQIRKATGLKHGELIPVSDMSKVYKFLLEHFEIKTGPLLNVIDEKHREDVYIDGGRAIFLILKGAHYWLVLDAKDDDRDDVNIKRGELSYDFETREDRSLGAVKIGEKKAYLMKPTICAIHYRDFNVKTGFDEGLKEKVFITNKQKCCARQFLDWLEEQHYERKHYNIVAHNGAKFDNYLVLSAMTKHEQQKTDVQLRGYSIISMQYFSHRFKDPCCFMPNSLESLCKSYRVEQKKLTEFEHNGVLLTNKNLCFYKPELDFWEFMELQQKDPEYWKLYVEYCLTDCYALTELWRKFRQLTEKMIGDVREDLLANCRVNSCSTVGGLAKRIIDTLNKKNPMFNDYKKFIDGDVEKYEFVCSFKRGGISQCNQPGKHNETIVSFDITSQYPTALVNMKIPCGQSKWVTAFDRTKYGYYVISNLKFNKDAKKFKPIAYQAEASLAWDHDWKSEDTVRIGSELLKYLINDCGLESFDVVQGLVSRNFVQGKFLFGIYVNKLFEFKAQQDVLKDKKDIEYNPAFREVIKLFLNSLTGKLVEDPSKYFSLMYTSQKTHTKLQGVGIEKVAKDEKMNEWVGAGVCVYDYSKELIFRYINCLPNKADDVVHVETDSIYFPGRCMEQFCSAVQSLESDIVKIGKGLGNVKQEHESVGPSYFLGKKFYYLRCGKENEDICKIKGIPAKTIDKAGNDVVLVNKQLYEDVYNWKEGDKEIVKEFAHLTKRLYGERTELLSHRMTRTIKPGKGLVYEEYFEIEQENADLFE